MCLTVFDADTPSGWEGAKKQLKNSYQKRLWKTTYDKLVWSPDMPIWLKSFCRFFCCCPTTQFVFDQCCNRHATCSFSVQEVFKRRPLPEFIAFPEWCQNFNWHLVSLKTCQEIKVQGTFWTFVEICSWQNLHFWLKSHSEIIIKEVVLAKSKVVFLQILSYSSSTDSFGHPSKLTFASN